MVRAIGRKRSQMNHSRIVRIRHTHPPKHVATSTYGSQFRVKRLTHIHGNFEKKFQYDTVVFLAQTLYRRSGYTHVMQSSTNTKYTGTYKLRHAIPMFGGGGGGGQATRDTIRPLEATSSAVTTNGLAAPRPPACAHTLRDSTISKIPTEQQLSFEPGECRHVAEATGRYRVNALSSIEINNCCVVLT